MSALVNLVIRDAVPGDHPAAAAVLVDAFADGDVTCWAEPNPVHRVQRLRRFFEELLVHTASYGTIRLAQSEAVLAGVACWYRYPLPLPAPDVHALSGDNPTVRGSGAAQRLSQLEDKLAVRHPSQRRHDYLAYLAVTGTHQCRGIGTALIRDHHTRLEQSATPAYLEANDPRNRELYLRLGYTDYGPPLTAADSPLVLPMWHQPTTDRP